MTVEGEQACGSSARKPQGVQEDKKANICTGIAENERRPYEQAKPRENRKEIIS